MNAKDLNNEGTRLRRNNQVAGLSGISNWGSRTKIGSGLDKWSYIYHESRPDPQSFCLIFTTNLDLTLNLSNKQTLTEAVEAVGQQQNFQ
jgi:hypothetical protein